MDRVELRNKLSGRIEKFRLDEYETDVYVRPLSALDRARIVDKYRALNKAEESDSAFETMTIETQCYVVSRGLVDEGGKRLYLDDEAPKIAEEFPCKALDALSKKILALSGMDGGQVDAEKNSQPVPNEDSNYVLQ